MPALSSADASARYLWSEAVKVKVALQFEYPSCVAGLNQAEAPGGEME